MPTDYKDQFYIIDPAKPPDYGTTLAVQIFPILDGDDDGMIQAFAKDFVAGHYVTGVWLDSVVVVEVGGKVREIHGVTIYSKDGETLFTPTDGTILTKAVFLKSAPGAEAKEVPVKALGPPCFVTGTLIDTPDGPRPVQDIAVGDLVITRDYGPQPVRWAGRRRVAGTGDYAPIRFAPGAMGNARPLLVSPQHRVLVDGWRAELFFAETEVLVAARHLVDGDRVHRLPVAQVTYHHVMFDQHQIIQAEGIWAESFHPGEVILFADPALRAELFGLFPELGSQGARANQRTALPVVAGRQARILVAKRGQVVATPA